MEYFLYYQYVVTALLFIILINFIFCFKGRVFVLLYGFIKKKNKTDIKESEIVKNRMNKYKNP